VRQADLGKALQRVHILPLEAKLAGVAAGIEERADIILNEGSIAMPVGTRGAQVLE
jgi:hypothetical protein